MEFNTILSKEQSLDPENWDGIRALGHKMIDDVMDYLSDIRNMPSWQSVPQSTKELCKENLPSEGTDIQSIYHSFFTHIMPYPKGNIHPRFWAWVQGTGTPMGVLADMLASAMNSNVTIGEHSAMYVDEQVVNWCKEMMGFSAEASGILVSGGSIANITGLIVARNHQTAMEVRTKGIKNLEKQLAMYCSTETHSCVLKGGEIIGIGSDNIRKIAVNDDFQIDTDLLVEQIKKDIAHGIQPICIIANVGTVNTGAIDDIKLIRTICDDYNLWMHIDGAFGALAKLAPEYEIALKAIESADSIAFDLHKWMYMPYEVGCILIHEKKIHRDAFSITPNYLLSHERGLAAGPDPINNYGMELSRGFKALKVWMSIKEHGINKYVAIIRQNIAQAFYLGHLVQKEKSLELLHEVTMNIVCFRYIDFNKTTEELNLLNKNILMTIHERGIASPSSTILHGKYCIRVAITNHRSKKTDFDALVKAVIEIGTSLVN